MAYVQSRLDRWVDSVYRRTRRRYHVVLIVATFLMEVLLLGPMLVGLVGSIWADNARDLAIALLPVEIAFVAAVPSLLWVVLVHHRSLIRHLRGDPDVDLVELWVTSVAELPKGVMQAVAGVLVPLLGATIYLGIEGDFSLVAHAMSAATMVILVLGGASLIYLMWELALRPVIREIAPQLPRDLVVSEKGLSLASKLLFLLVSLCLFNGAAIGNASAYPLSHDARLVVIVTMSILLSVTLAGLIAWMIEHSFVSRIDELREALEDFSGSGREEIRLAPLAGDDLDQVGYAFNEMVQRIVRNESEMRASQARIVAVTDAERRRMERDLHDGAQQHLALLNLQLSALDHSLRDHPEFAASVGEMRSILADALAEMRDLAHGIYPAVLENDGLVAALGAAATRSALPTRLEVADDMGRASRDIETAVYFCCLEALQNASKYAGSGASATITLRQDQSLFFSVSDDGVGFGQRPTVTVCRTCGTASVLSVDTSDRIPPGRGVTVSGSVPLTAARRGDQTLY